MKERQFVVALEQEYEAWFGFTIFVQVAGKRQRLAVVREPESAFYRSVVDPVSGWTVTKFFACPIQSPERARDLAHKAVRDLIRRAGEERFLQVIASAPALDSSKRSAA